MQLPNRGNQTKSEAAARGCAATLQTEETPKYPFAHCFRDAGTVVANADLDAVRIGARANDDAAVKPGMQYCIFDQIRKQLCQQFAVTADDNGIGSETTTSRMVRLLAATAACMES